MPKEEGIFKLPGAGQRLEQLHPANTPDPDPSIVLKKPSPDSERKKIVVEGSLDNKRANILLDSGSDLNLISEATYQATGCKPRKQHNGVIYGVDGDPVKINGAVSLEVKIGNLAVLAEFIVAPNLNIDAIIGSNFLQDHQCALDFHTKRLFTGTESSAVPFLDIDTPQAANSYRNRKFSEAERAWLFQVSTEVPGIFDERILEANKDGNGEEVEVITSPNKCLEINPNHSMPASETVKTEEVEAILELTAPNVAPRLKKRLRDLVSRYRDVFALRNEELGYTDLVHHEIDVGDSPPIKLRPYRMAPGKVTEVRKQIDDMLKRGIIRESNSPYSAPIVLVKKKDGTSRFCVDYRKLNSVTKKDAYPIPRIDQTLENLKGARYFSSMDLATGYWQVPVASRDQHKTAFGTSDGGLFEYLVMAFGLTNAPATFQRLMNKLFEKQLFVFILIFLDDLLAYSESEEEHIKHLEIIFQILRAANLKLKPKKCSFFQTEVQFLGHIVSEDGARPDPEKVKAVANWPTPTNLTEVRSFLGFCGYYRRFVKNFAGIAQPLHELAKKNVHFEWNEQRDEAFQTLKKILTQTPILKFPDYNFPFVVDTDASANSLGAVLSNIIDGEEMPLVFASRVLSKTETNYSTTKREALAVIQAMKWFRSYLWGHKFILRTDHASLQWLFRQNSDGMTFRMVQVLQEFDFEVVHRPGQKHGNADGLSRQTTTMPDWSEGEKETHWVSCPEPMDWTEALNRCNTSWNEELEPERNLLSPQPMDSNNDDGNTVELGRTIAEVREEQRTDPAISKILQWAQIDDRQTLAALPPCPTTRDAAVRLGPEVVAYWGIWNNLEVHAGVLYRKWQTNSFPPVIRQLVVPYKARRDILEQLHSSKVSGGHFAVQKTLDRIRQRFWWPTMRKDIENKCRTCEPCAARRAGKFLRAELQPIIVGMRFHKVAADILGPVTKAKTSGAKFILVFTDYFTKYVVTVPLNGMTAEEVALAFVQHWILRFGAPDSLHTDQGANFCSELMKETCTLLGIEKTRTSAYHPQGNGMVERHNRVIADVLSKYCAENPREWDNLIPYLTFVYNTTVHKTTQATPFSLVFGEECKYPIDLLYPKPQPVELLEVPQLITENFREAHEFARGQLGSTQRRQKDLYNKKVTGGTIMEGDKVWLFSPHKAKSRKFYLPWDGPFEVLEKISETNYKVAKPNDKRRWLIVHYNRLKPYVAEQPISLPRSSPYRRRVLDTEQQEDEFDPMEDELEAVLIPREHHRRDQRMPIRGQSANWWNWPDNEILHQIFPEDQNNYAIPEPNEVILPDEEDIRQEQSEAIDDPEPVDDNQDECLEEDDTTEDLPTLRRSERTKNPVKRLGIDY